MGKDIHIVPHFHWDREWYFTSEESRIYLVNDMEEILDMLETHPDYPCFVLDGQTSILEDYLRVKPENEDRLKKQVEKGRLIIGPWYTQTDEMVVGGESIVRNLLYGKLDCEKYGPRMMIGYLPDSFGQSARMPQILNGFGITRFLFWRGASERKGVTRTEFIWEGADGANVLALLMPYGYAIGKYLPADPKPLKARLDKVLPALDRGTKTDHILLPNGHDQMPIQKNIFQVMEQIEACYPDRKAVLGRYEDLFEILEKTPGLDRVQGEFLDGKYMRVHRSIYSSRADLKSANTRIENKITNLLEPLASIAYSLGFTYEHGLMELIWKELLKNHAHDSIGCCCGDKVHRAIADRFFLAEERTDRLIDHYKRRIADAMDDEDGPEKLLVFNTLPYARKGVIMAKITTKMENFRLIGEDGQDRPFEILDKKMVDATLVDRQIGHYGLRDPFYRYTVVFEDTSPSMGYTSYRVEAVSGKAGIKTWTAGADTLENRYYQILCEPNGTLTVTDKKTGRIYKDVLLVEDGGDDGDGYDYSPPVSDHVLTNRYVQAERCVKNGPFLSAADISFRLPVPKDLESRRKGRMDGYMDIGFHIELEKDAPVIRVVMTVDNQAADHRVRVLVPGDKSSAFSLCDDPFGMIRRPAHDDAMDVWEAEKWVERPDAIYPFLSYTRMDGPDGMAVLTNSVREYEITGEARDTIAVTVFRSVGVLGKEDLVRRPGRPSGIKLDTPDSQMPGVNRYDIALTCDWENAARRAKEYLTPLFTYNKMTHDALRLNKPEIRTERGYSLLQIDDPSVVLSALKKEEKGDGLILRCYNGDVRERTARLKTDLLVAGEVRLDETGLRSIKDPERLLLKPDQNKTLLLKKR